MSTTKTAKTQYVTANGITLAYRRLGCPSGTPLVMLMHFRGNMDFWDPALVDTLALSRPIILLDNAGIGKSGGEIPLTIKGWADHVIALMKALNVLKIDLLGFSMGGFTAQMVTLNAPGLVRRLILAGTRASQGPMAVNAESWALRLLARASTPLEVEDALAKTFFPHTEAGRAAAAAYWRRIHERTEDRVDILDESGTGRQIQAVHDWSTPNPENSYDRLGELRIPVFIANGNHDDLIPSINSWQLMENISDSHLHIYPNAGHGFLSQHASIFAAHVDLFLGSPCVEAGKSSL